MSKQTQWKMTNWEDWGAQKDVLTANISLSPVLLIIGCAKFVFEITFRLSSWRYSPESHTYCSSDSFARVSRGFRLEVTYEGFELEVARRGGSSKLNFRTWIFCSPLKLMFQASSPRK